MPKIKQNRQIPDRVTDEIVEKFMGQTIDITESYDELPLGVARRLTIGKREDFDRDAYKYGLRIQKPGTSGAKVAVADYLAWKYVVALNRAHNKE